MIYLNKIQVYCGPNGKIGKQNLFNHKYSSLVKPLNPYWVTGFCDRSASFIIIPSFRKSNQKWEIKATFEILVDSKYSEILERIQFFFGIGKTYKIGTKAYYRVTKISDLTNIIIPHFKSFPLLSGRTKVSSFILWSKAVELLKEGAHKTPNGFMEILGIYAAIGRGISDKVKSHFPNLLPAILPEYKIKDVDIEPWWLSGYLTIYCHFQLAVLVEGWKLKMYYKLRHTFSFSRDISELNILNLIAEYLEAKTYVRTYGSRVDVNIAKLDTCEYLIKFFDKYPLQSSKHQEYLIWRDFVIRAKGFNDSNSLIGSSLDIIISDFHNLVEKLASIRD